MGGTKSLSSLTEATGFWVSEQSGTVTLMGHKKTINPLQKWSHLCIRNAVGFLKLLYLKTLSKNYSHFYIFLYLKLLLAGIRNKGVT